MFPKSFKFIKSIKKNWGTLHKVFSFPPNRYPLIKANRRLLGFTKALDIFNVSYLSPIYSLLFRCWVLRGLNSIVPKRANIISFSLPPWFFSAPF